MDSSTLNPKRTNEGKRVELARYFKNSSRSRADSNFQRQNREKEQMAEGNSVWHEAIKGTTRGR